MKRKTSDVPTRIYSFRCLPPLTEQKRVEDQFYVAHQYRNALVEIELRLRERIRDVQVNHPVVGPLLLQYEGADAAIEDTYDDLRAAKSGTATPDLEPHCERLGSERERRSECYQELRAAKLEHKDELVLGYDAARKQSHADKLVSRKDFILRGLRHGTYSRIEDAIKQAARSTKEPLHFERYTGEGSIGTQLIASSRSGEAMGLTVRELHSLADTRVQLQALPDNYNQMPRNRRRHAARVHAWLRIGTVPETRAPIFAQFPVTFHRPLPKDAVIKWAYVVRKRIGHQFEWRFQLTLESETFRTPTQPVGEGACAIDLGWRRIFDDEENLIGLRAAYVVDDEGREREVLVPHKLLGGMGKVADLAKIRSENLDRARNALVSWLVNREIPQWMIDRTRGLPQWRAPRKFQALADLWTREESRFEGDADALEALRAWAKQDRHLQSWEEHQRQRLIAHRRETWRVLATELARKYAVIVIEDGSRTSKNADLHSEPATDADEGKNGKVSTMRLTEIPGWERPSPEDGDPSDGREQRRMSRLAAVGELRGELFKAVSKTGAQIKVADTVNSTMECAWCGHVQTTFVPRVSIMYECENCARAWDQDANAARNLLHRSGFLSGPVPPIVTKVLAPDMAA